MSNIFCARVISTLYCVLFCGVLLFTLATAGFTQDTAGSDLKIVVAQGVGAGPDRAKARDEAIQDAQRKAIEQGLGLYIKSTTLVNNLTLVSDSISKESSGFVHEYNVVEENYDDATDLYKVTIKASVSLERIEAVAENLYDQLKIAGSPRILLLLSGTDSAPDPSGVTNALTSALVDKGFKVLDEDQLTAVRQKDALRLLNQGEVDAKTVMLLQDLADLIIVGKVSADDPASLANDPATYSQKVTLDAKIIRVDTAEVIGAKRGLGIGADFSQKSALETAEDKAGEDYLNKNMTTLLREVLDPCKVYTVKIAGCSFTQLSQVDDKLALSRFTRSTDARFEEGYGVITVPFSGNIKMLATHLETAEGIHLQVVSVTGMTLMVKIVANSAN